MIERTQVPTVLSGDPSTTTVGFPVYDAHGNDVATLSRSGSGGFSLADRRTYDAWGVVRSQQSGGDPRLRYCASLGHRQDDESGLVYMRARTYEPTSGRFISEDPDRDGFNPYVYGYNNPVQNVDQTGRLVGLAVCAGVWWVCSLVWQPTSPEMKILKVMIESTFAAAGMADLYCSIGAVAEGEQPGKKVLYSAVAAGVGAIACMVLVQQVVLLLMIASIDDDSGDLDGKIDMINSAGSSFPLAGMAGGSDN